MKKILITGGHITPAIAVADQLRKRLARADILFVGRLRSLEGSGSPSEEASIVGAHGFRFLSVSAGRVTRTFNIFSVIGMLRIPFGFFQAFSICLVERPDIIVSFGGYIALPVVIAGWLLGVPSITHEQTHVPGLANRIIARLARRVCVSFSQTLAAFPKQKTVMTGLPIRESIFHPPKTAPLPLENKKPLVFVTGGSLGAQSLNRLVFPIIGALTKRFTVVHQTGRLDFPIAPKIPDYVAVAYLPENSYAWVINHADLVVSRSGANTVGEIAILGKVALFVPLPWSAGNEQYANARYLEEAGTSRVLKQKELTGETLLEAIGDMIRNKSTYQDNADKLRRGLPIHAAASMADEILAHGS